MISAIKEIGNWYNKKGTTIGERIQAKILTINLKGDKGNFKFEDVKGEDFDSEKEKNYLYEKDASKGNKPAPFCFITDKNSNKTFNKIKNWFKKISKNVDKITSDNKEKKFLKKIYEIIKENEKKIVSQINILTEKLYKKEKKFLTLKLKNKYLGEYEILKECIKYFKDEKRKRSLNIGTCSICGETDEVSGKTEVYKFYTIDKPGFITGGFNETSAWKNYPVCKECENLLNIGKRYIENKLKFQFYGLNYFLIPKSLLNDIKIIEKILDNMNIKKINLNKRVIKRITNDENEILEDLSKNNDFLTLDFLFLRKEQSAEKILLLITDVFPSRIKIIFEAKNKVDEIFKNNEEQGFTFGTIRSFFSKSDENKKQNDLNKYFLEIVDSVFKNKMLDFSFLVKFYMATIRREFVNNRNFVFKVKDALMSTIFFEQLKLIKFEEVKEMEESLFDEVFIRYSNAFNTSVKKGIFLLGSLTQFLLNKQYIDRRAAPFIKKLKGLKMDARDIKKMLPEVQNKLEQYDSFDKGKQIIASAISKYLLDAGEDWKMSVDEINFYFVCGMNLADEIANIIYNKKQKEE